MTGSITDQVAALVSLRVLTAAQEPPLRELCAAKGVLRRVVELLATDTGSKDTQVDAAWIITNVASGDSSCTK
jgi:hypothetical protein